MYAGEAALWFADTVLDGWNGTAWVDNISCGDFHTYDRFITERTFGAKKRLFLAHQDNHFDPTVYSVVRTPDAKVWIVVSENADITDAAYAQTYLILEARFVAQSLSFTTSTLASGQQGSLVETVGATYVCDLEQFSLDQSDRFYATAYGIYKVVLPGYAAVDDDKELLINGSRFEIQESYTELLTKVCRVIMRGPSA